MCQQKQNQRKDKSGATWELFKKDNCNSIWGYKKNVYLGPGHINKSSLPNPESKAATDFLYDG